MDGRFLASDSSTPAGQAIVTELLTRCLQWVDVVLEKYYLKLLAPAFHANLRPRQGRIDERFQNTYERLREIRNALERLSLTQAWSLRETDLYSYQRQLDEIDERRVGGNFEDTSGSKADIHTQRVSLLRYGFSNALSDERQTLLHLLRRSYAYIYTLMISSEPVSEALLPIYNQLQTLKRCLLEVQRSGGVSSARELYPYSMKVSLLISDKHLDGF